MCEKIKFHFKLQTILITIKANKKVIFAELKLSELLRGDEE